MKKSFPTLTFFFSPSHRVHIGKQVKYLILSLYYTGFRNDELVD